MTTALVDNPTTTQVEPATVTWVGTSGDWYDSANWSTGKVPTVNDIVTIGNMARGTTYNISFSDGNPVYGGLNFLASNGGILKLSELTFYQGSGQSDIKIEATGQGSLIDLSDLTTLKGGQSLNVLNINSLQGGEINFGELTQINGGTTEVIADGAGSTINFAKLTEFIDDDFDRSLLKTRNGGFINVAKVTKLEEVDLSIENSVLYLESLTTYVGDNQVEAINGGQISLIKLNTVSGQILQVTAVGNKSRVVISEALEENKYLIEERSGGDVIVSNNSSALNYQPIATIPIPAQNANEDEAFSFTVPSNTFVDLDPSDSLIYTATLSNASSPNPTLPSWLIFNAATRTFSGTPNNADVDTLVLIVKATDEKGLTASTGFTLNVINVNDAPTISNAIADQSTTADQNFSFTLAANTFTDIDAGDILTYTVPNLPTWLTFEPATRTISGIPTNADVGIVNISVTATDSSGATVTDTFALSVAGITINNPPTLENEINTQTATENQLFTFQVPNNTFQDIDGDPLTYTATLDQIGQPDLLLPGWLTFDGASQTFSGTPTTADVGLINLNVIVTDPSGGQAVETFSLMVADANNAPVVNNSIPNQGAIINRSFSYVVPNNTFTDDDGDSLAYSATLADGTPLPTWLSFDPLTLIFSAETVPVADYGTLDISVTAIDPLTASASDTFALNIDIDAAQYGASYADLIAAFGYDLPGLNQHYRELGRNENRNPDTFDEYRYLAGYDDLLNASEIGQDAGKATEHYILYGSQASVGAEGRDPLFFKSDIYIASYSDLIEAVQPITDYADKLEFAGQHYVLFGRGESENRAREIFNPTSYLANNPDVAAHPFYGTLSGATQHYIEFGFFDGHLI